MFRQFIEKVAQADIFMISSFLIFFIFFMVVSIMLLRTKKEEIEEKRSIPLKPDSINNLEEQL